MFFTFSVTCTSSLSIGTPVSLETTNSLLDLLCFYGDGESTPEKEDKKEDLEEPGVWKTCWSLFLSFICSGSVSTWCQDFCAVTTCLRDGVRWSDAVNIPKSYSGYKNPVSDLVAKVVSIKLNLVAGTLSWLSSAESRLNNCSHWQPCFYSCMQRRPLVPLV